MHLNDLTTEDKSKVCRRNVNIVQQVERHQVESLSDDVSQINKATSSEKSRFYRKFYTKLKITHFILIPLIITAAVAIISAIYISLSYKSGFSDIDIVDVADWRLFQTLDLDNDGFLSAQEFQPFVHSCRKRMFDQMGTSQDAENNAMVLEEMFDMGEVLTIKAEFEPLVMESLTKDIKVISRIPEQSGSLKGLVTWIKPRLHWITIPASYFRIFLPPPDSSYTSGTTWWVIPPPRISHQLSSARYSTEIERNLLPLATILRMFHQNVFFVTRFPPQGTAAVLRAVKDDILDIVFRMHVEFQLNQPPDYPFWFTPSQFRGRIIMTKNSSKIVYFDLEVPTDRLLNVDMEWLYGPNEMENMEVDIGFIPKMHLESTRPSISVLEVEDLLEKPIVNISDVYLPDDTSFKEKLKSLSWDLSISLRKSHQILQKMMYPFTEVKYYNFTEAFSLAVKENKLVHVIVLWGSLDDQSC